MKIRMGNIEEGPKRGGRIPKPASPRPPAPAGQASAKISGSCNMGIRMILEEINDAADMAEKWNGAYKLNFEELPFNALAAWVALNPHKGTFDVESVKDAFESWWREERERE